MEATAGKVKKVKKKKSVKRIIVKTILLLLLAAILAGAQWLTYTTLKAKYTRTFNGYTASIGSISETLEFTGKL